MDDYKTSVISLTPKNFHIWIEEVKSIALKAKVWEYVDPVGKIPEPADPLPPSLSKYLIDVPASAAAPTSSEPTPTSSQPTVQNEAPDPPVQRPAVEFFELSADQREAWKMEMSKFQMLEKKNERVAHGI